MKKILSILICGVMVISIVGCSKKEESVNYNFSIVDTTKDMEDFTCSSILEKIFEDDEYYYYLSCIKSKFIIVKYDDGTEEDIRIALNNKRVKIESLDDFGIEYLVGSKNK